MTERTVPNTPNLLGSRPTPWMNRVGRLNPRNSSTIAAVEQSQLTTEPDLVWARTGSGRVVSFRASEVTVERLIGSAGQAIGMVFPSGADDLTRSGRWASANANFTTGEFRDNEDGATYYHSVDAVDARTDYAWWVGRGRTRAPGART